MRYDTILFDLDGTLLNTLDDLADSVNAVLVKEGCSRRTKDEIKAFIGDGVKSLMERSLPQDTAESDMIRCLVLFREIYQQNMNNQTKPYENIPDLLRRLKEMGVKIGVVSNKPDEATKEMCSFYFQDKIDAAIGDNAQRKKKPEPDNVYEALMRLGSEKERTLYVGDSDIDVAAAKNAGLDCAGVTWGYRSRETLAAAGADYIIDQPRQLAEIFEK